MNATLQKTQVENAKVVSRAEWLQAREHLVAKEKEVARLIDELNADRRTLPWVKIEKDYVFDGPSGKVTFSQLFDGHSLFIKHFMGPGPKVAMRRMCAWGRSSREPSCASAKSRRFLCFQPSFRGAD